MPLAFRGLEIRSLGAGIERGPAPSFDLIKAGCGWLRTAHETGGKDYDQPQWNLMAFATTFMEDGGALLHELSDQYPTYTFEETEKLWDRKVREQKEKGLGWPSCRGDLRTPARPTARPARTSLQKNHR